MSVTISLPFILVAGVRLISDSVYPTGNSPSARTQSPYQQHIHNLRAQILPRYAHDKHTTRFLTLLALKENFKIISYCCALVSSLFLTACTSNSFGIGTRVIKCCPTATYQTFVVTTRDMPAFLGPIMASNFSVALASHGLTPKTPPINASSTNENAEGRPLTDLVIKLIYAQDNLTRDTKRDDFAEHIPLGDSLRFVAIVMIEIREADTHQLVWEGQVQRLHDVGAGEFMHTGKASIALLDAFTRVLIDFPNFQPLSQAVAPTTTLEQSL